MMRSLNAESNLGWKQVISTIACAIASPSKSFNGGSIVGGDEGESDLLKIDGDRERANAGDSDLLKIDGETDASLSARMCKLTRQPYGDINHKGVRLSLNHLYELN